MGKKEKHLEMIQGVINRLASNSFALKGWAVTLVAGLFALSSKETDKLFFYITYVPIVVFWGLDSYYLKQERLYRALYDKVRKIENDDNVDYSMNVSLEEFKTYKNKWVSSLLSRTELFFYIPLAGITLIIIRLSI